MYFGFHALNLFNLIALIILVFPIKGIGKASPYFRSCPISCRHMREKGKEKS
jgi:hypothetical protein